MQFYHIIAVYIVLSLSGCDFSGGSATGDNENHPTTQLTLAVAPQIAWMPWYLANEEGLFDKMTTKHQIQVKFISENYNDAIEKFLTEEVHAIAISNIDAIAQIIRRDIKADVILITNNHIGNEAILLPQQAESSTQSLKGKTFALVQHSVAHYLLDRYLIRHQIPFDQVNILNTTELDIPNKFINEQVYGVVTSNPNLYMLSRHSATTKILFDSRQIPKEIFDLIVVRRETLVEYPEFAQVLLASWFSVMKRLQGSKKNTTLDAMAGLAQISRQEFEKQLASLPFNDTPSKALAAIRDRRRLKKSMRHLRYFIERHGLMGNQPISEWVSYPGRTPALLHFNGQPLQNLLVP
ncbi:MAG: ABC transporter substrate-binding protein [Pseudomonadota bacterium]